MKVIVFICTVGAVFAAREPKVHTCDEEPDSGLCLAYMPMYYYNASSDTCQEFIYGGCQGNGNRYGTAESCLEHCSGCSAKPKTGRCRGRLHRYYYDPMTNCCKPFIYGGCGGNKNNYEKEKDCLDSCALSSPSACEQEKVAGPCRGALLRYFYNKDTGKCEKFIYGGCRGNDNNFNSQEDCERTCIRCSAKPETGPGRRRFHRYYYDPRTNCCKPFIYGGCGGNKNNYKTKDHCLDSCAMSVPSACEQEKVVGPCKGAFPRYFYNKDCGECEKFIYGGCGGNDNNFNSKEDCEGTCIAKKVRKN